MQKKRSIIITSYIETTIRANIDIRPDDYVICADGGFDYADKEQIIPDVIIGDFDSSSFSRVMEVIESGKEYSYVEIIRTKPEKDDPDTMMCVRHAMDKGYDSIVIVGGLGGRLDHTIANIQTLSHILDNGGTGWIIDGGNKATMLNGPSGIILEQEGSDYFSIYSFTEKCTGIYEINAKYPLEDASLNQSFPIGTSNEFLKGPAVIKVDQGKLLVIKSNK